MTVFSFTWDATFLAQPADNESINLGASRIRLFKDGVTERLEVDHSLAGDAEDGKHMQVTLRAAALPPVPEPDQGILYNVIILNNAELHWADDGGNHVQLTQAGSVYPDFPGNVSVALNLSAGSAEIINDLHVFGETFLAANDPQFYAVRDGLGNPIINVDVDSYILYDRALGRFAFVANGVTVGTFP